MHLTPPNRAFRLKIRNLRWLRRCRAFSSKKTGASSHWRTDSHSKILDWPRSLNFRMSYSPEIKLKMYRLGLEDLSTKFCWPPYKTAWSFFTRTHSSVKFTYMSWIRAMLTVTSSRSASLLVASYACRSVTVWSLCTTSTRNAASYMT